MTRNELERKGSFRFLHHDHSLVFAPGCGGSPKPRKQRRPSVRPYFEQARKGGETGAVRVSITDPNGYTITVASGESDAVTSSNPWDEVSRAAKH